MSKFEGGVQYRCPYKPMYLFLHVHAEQGERGKSGVAPMARAQPRKVVLPPRHFPLCVTPVLPHRMNDPAAHHSACQLPVVAMRPTRDARQLCIETSDVCTVLLPPAPPAPLQA